MKVFMLVAKTKEGEELKIPYPFRVQADAHGIVLKKAGKISDYDVKEEDKDEE